MIQCHNLHYLRTVEGLTVSDVIQSKMNELEEVEIKVMRVQFNIGESAHGMFHFSRRMKHRGNWKGQERRIRLENIVPSGWKYVLMEKRSEYY